MEDLDVLTLVFRWIHFASAMLLIGGAAFACLAFVPGVRRVFAQEEEERVREAVRPRWAMVNNLAMAGLIVSGVVNFVRLVVMTDVKPMPYHAIFGVKVILALTIFVLVSLLAGRSKAFSAMRARPVGWLAVVLVLAGVIILLSGMLYQIRT